MEITIPAFFIVTTGASARRQFMEGIAGSLIFSHFIKRESLQWLIIFYFCAVTKFVHRIIKAGT